MAQKHKKLTDYTASLSIQRLLQLYFVGFAVFLLLITTAVVNYRVQSDFATYLDAEKRESLDNLALSVQNNYANDPESWQKFTTQPNLFNTAINEAFAHFTRRGIVNRANRPLLALNEGKSVNKNLTHVDNKNLVNELEHTDESIQTHDRLTRRDVSPRRTPFNRKRQFANNRRPILPVSLVNQDGDLIYGHQVGNENTHFMSPVTNASGEVIATFTLPKNSNFSSQQQQAYLNSFKRTIWIILALGIVLSYLLARYLARKFTQPIKHLNQATKALENRNFQIRIPIVRDDELGQLSHSFNQMADKLEAFEKQKKLWLGNISHDLRTPVAILKAEVEAMVDGIKQPDAEAFQSLHQEIDSLSKMLDDFHQAAMSDINHNKTKAKTESDIEFDLKNTGIQHDRITSNYAPPLNPKPILTQLSKRSHQSINKAGLELSTQWHDEDVLITLSEVSLTKIWQNLLQNSLRYTDSTPEVKGELKLDTKPELKPRIKIETTVKKDKLILTWQDSAPTVSSELLGKLTEPLFRIEKSRNRQFAGSGLGLSIVKDIVTSAGGEIEIKQSELGGLKVVITLPIVK